MQLGWPRGLQLTEEINIQIYINFKNRILALLGFIHQYLDYISLGLFVFLKVLCRSNSIFAKSRTAPYNSLHIPCFTTSFKIISTLTFALFDPKPKCKQRNNQQKHSSGIWGMWSQEVLPNGNCRVGGQVLFSKFSCSAD